MKGHYLSFAEVERFIALNTKTAEQAVQNREPGAWLAAQARIHQAQILQLMIRHFGTNGTAEGIEAMLKSRTSRGHQS